MNEPQTISHTDKQQLLEAIFKRPFAKQIVNGEKVFVTALPNESKCIPLFGDLPQFIFHNYEALKSLDTLGQAYKDDDRKYHYWAVSEQELKAANLDQLLDTLLKNKTAPRLPEQKPSQQDELDAWHGDGRKTPAKLEKETITPQWLARYLMALIHQSIPAQKKFYSDQDDDVLLQLHNLDIPITQVRDGQILDKRLLNEGADAYTRFEKTSGLKPVFSIHKSSSQPFYTVITARGGHNETTTEVNSLYKKGHVSSAVYGLGYHIRGFAELDRLTAHVSQKLAETGKTLDTLALPIRVSTQISSPATTKSDQFNPQIARLPLPCDRFVDYDPEALLQTNASKSFANTSLLRRWLGNGGNHK